MSIFHSKFSIFAACACLFLSCTPSKPEPVGKVTLTVTVSAVVGKTAAFRLQANGEYKNNGPKDWQFSSDPHTDSDFFLVGQDFKVEEPKTNSAVVTAVLTYSSASAEVKTELTGLPGVELVLDTKGEIPLVIKDKDGALLKAPVKVPAGNTVYTIAPANP